MGEAKLFLVESKGNDGVDYERCGRPAAVRVEMDVRKVARREVASAR